MSNDDGTTSPEPDTTPSDPPSTDLPSGQPRDPDTGRFASEPDPAPAPTTSEPAWAQGRSREELLQLTQGALQALKTGFDPIGQPPTGQRHSPPDQSQQQQMQQPNAPPTFPTDPYSDSYAADMERYLAWRDQQTLSQVQQFAQPIMQNVGAMARAQVEKDPKYAAAFERWPLEVEQLLQNVPIQQRTVESYQMAADLVKGRHTDELIAEAGERPRRAPSSDTARSDNAPPPAEPVFDDPVDEFWASQHPYVVHAKSQGVTKRDFKDTATVMGIDAATYIESIKKSPGQWTPGGVSYTGMGA